jgi:hypothetical protein
VYRFRVEKTKATPISRCTSPWVASSQNSIFHPNMVSQKKGKSRTTIARRGPTRRPAVLPAAGTPRPALTPVSSGPSRAPFPRNAAGNRLKATPFRARQKNCGNSGTVSFVRIIKRILRAMRGEWNVARSAGLGLPGTWVSPQTTHPVSFAPPNAVSLLQISNCSPPELPPPLARRRSSGRSPLASAGCDCVAPPPGWRVR